MTEINKAEYYSCCKRKKKCLSENRIAIAERASKWRSWSTFSKPRRIYFCQEWTTMTSAHQKTRFSFGPTSHCYIMHANHLEWWPFVRETLWRRANFKIIQISFTILEAVCKNYLLKSYRSLSPRGSQAEFETKCGRYQEEKGEEISL